MGSHLRIILADKVIRYNLSFRRIWLQCGVYVQGKKKQQQQQQHSSKNNAILRSRKNQAFRVGNWHIPCINMLLLIFSLQNIVCSCKTSGHEGNVLLSFPSYSTFLFFYYNLFYYYIIAPSYSSSSIKVFSLHLHTNLNVFVLQYPLLS